MAAAFIVWFAYVTVEVMRQGSVDQAHKADCIVVFGAAEYAGRPSKVYRARLDHAYDLFQQGLAPLIITTGGAGGETQFSEGQVGRDYLLAKGIPDVNLIAETQAANTDESTQRVAVIMRTNGLHEALLVSDAYHLFRARSMMFRQGIIAYTSPRPESVPKTAWGRLVAALRETFSYMLYSLHLT